MPSDIRPPGRIAPNSFPPKPQIGGDAMANPMPPGKTVSAAVTRSFVAFSLRNGRVHIPTPLIGPLPALMATPIIITQARARSSLVRSVPRPHVAKPVVAPIVPVTTAIVAVTDQSVRRALQRGKVLVPHYAAPILAVLAAPRAPPVVIYEAAQRRALIGRNLLNPHLPNPLTLSPVVPSLMATPIIIGQARSRSTLVRTVPKPHLAKPIVAAAVTTPLAPGRIVLVRGRSFPGRVHIPAPLIGPLASLATTPIVVGQASRRALVARSTPKPHLAKPVLTPAVTAPLPHGTFVLVAALKPVRRWFGGRVHIPDPLVVSPVGPPTLAATPIIIGQANRRLRFTRGLIHIPGPLISELVVAPLPVATITLVRGRSFPGRVHLPNPTIIDTAPTPPQLIATPTVIRRAFTRSRARFAPHLAKPVVGTPVVAPVAASIVVGQAVKRGQLRPRLLEAHLPGPVVAPGGPPLAPAKVVQVRGRFFTGRTRTAPPVVSQIPPPAPLARGLTIGQAVRRALVGRTVPTAHVAKPPLVQPPLPPAKVVQQRGRFFVGKVRTAPPVVTQTVFPPLPAGKVIQVRSPWFRGSVHTAKPVQGYIPVPPAVVVSQTGKRSTLQRRVPGPHVAQPIVAPGAGFIGSRAVRVLQAIRRALIGRFPPAPHTAPVVAPLPIPDTNPTIVVGRERHNISGSEEFGIVGREAHNVSGTEDFGIVGRERQPWP